MQNTLALNFAALVDFAREQGSLAAAGDDSLATLAMQVGYSAEAKMIDASACRDIYVAYAEAQNSSLTGRKVDLGNAASIKVQVSCLTTFAKVGKLGRSELFDRVLPHVPAKTSGFNAMVKVNRVQLKVEGAELTDEQIIAALAPAEKQDRDVFAWIAAEVKRLEKASEEYGVRLDDVISTLKAAVLPAQEQEEEPEQEQASEENIPQNAPDVTNLADFLSQKYHVTSH